MLQLLGIIALLLALVPVCMAGGQMIAAFMTGQRILAWVCMTLASTFGLIGGALAALAWVLPRLDAGGPIWRLVALAILVLPAWLAYAAGKLWMEKAK